MKFIAKKLSKDFKVYIFDRRCCGKSEKNCLLCYEESEEFCHRHLVAKWLRDFGYEVKEL